MNLRDLQYLTALAEHRHFGRAAAASFVSQPTLSAQLRKLEHELGVTLIERTPRKVMLTPIGQEIAERARRVVNEIAEIKQVARRSQRPEAGTVRLGIFPTLAPYLLPHVIPAINARFPELQLLLTEEKSHDLLGRLHDGRLDAALLALPVDEAGLHVRFLFEEPFVLAVPSRHPLAQREELSMDELAGHDLMLLEDGHCLREQALDVCRLTGASERSEFRATSLETLRQMVAANVGLTLLPALSITPPVANPVSIHLLRFHEPAPSRKIAMVWRRSTALGDFLPRLAEVFCLPNPNTILPPLTPAASSPPPAPRQSSPSIAQTARSHPGAN